MRRLPRRERLLGGVGGAQHLVAVRAAIRARAVGTPTPSFQAAGQPSEAGAGPPALVMLSSAEAWKSTERPKADVGVGGELQQDLIALATPMPSMARLR